VTRPAALVVVLLLLLAAGCTTKTEISATEPSAASARSVSPEHNPTDAAYAHELSAMHWQAVDLVAMVGTKDVSGDVADLAVSIGRSRAAELDELERMMRAWREQPPEGDFHGNPGELTMRQLSELYELEGAVFEEQWLERMIGNHRGAVAMSRAEVDNGLNAEARELASRLVRTQGAQLEALERLAAE
jgi:uncharacterized protein (DUF305 family)